MPVRNVSHIAIGVREMDNVLPFWTEVVGFHVSLDAVDPPANALPPPITMACGLLATRAASVYGFELMVLQAVADRVGPTVDELATPLAPKDYPVYPDQTRCTIFNTGLARMATTG